jgi:Putative DNA-binding domain
MPELTDTDILNRLSNTEDSTVERKTANDYRDCLKTAVAFSNSLPIGDPAVVFIGVFDDGRIEDDNNLESLQRKVSAEIDKIYPAIYPQMKVMEKDSKKFLAMIVRGSGNRPHFAGQAYIRDGTQTIVASEAQFEGVVAQRNSKVYEILKWKGQTVTTVIPSRETIYGGTTRDEPEQRTPRTLVHCDQFRITLESVSVKGDLISYPLRLVEINHDHTERRLELRLLRD